MTERKHSKRTSDTEDNSKPTRDDLDHTMARVGFEGRIVQVQGKKPWGVVAEEGSYTESVVGIKHIRRHSLAKLIDVVEKVGTRLNKNNHSQ